MKRANEVAPSLRGVEVVHLLRSAQGSSRLWRGTGRGSKGLPPASFLPVASLLAVMVIVQPALVPSAGATTTVISARAVTTPTLLREGSAFQVLARPFVVDNLGAPGRAIVSPVPAPGTANVWFAYATSGAPGDQESCPPSSVLSQRCSLARALSLAGPGGIVELATPGGAGVYRGNWRVLTAGTSASGPLTVEPASPGPRPVLSGNGGGSAGCETPSCDGAVLSVGAGVHLELRDVVIRDANDTTSGLGGAIQNIQGGVVSISGSAFMDDEANADGGAIDNADLDGTGTLTVTGSTFSNDFAVNGDGGAIANADLGGTGQVWVSSSGFYDNGALSGDGGAIDNGDTRGKGTLHVTGCAFEQNAAGRAGAIDNGDNASGTLTVASSSFITNVAASGDAGAIDNADWGGQGTAHITTSTFHGDDTIGNGGAIDNADSEPTSRGTTYVSDSTLSANTADVYGGAIDNGDGGLGTVVLWASTLSANRANNMYGGFNRRGGSNVHNGRYGTIWTAADIFSGPCRTDGGTWQDAGYNVGDGGTCLYRGPHDIAHGARYLVGLGNYGGSTETELPTSANPAIGAVPLGAKAELDRLQVRLCPTTDQRGTYSPSGQPCDTGAIQV